MKNINLDNSEYIKINGKGEAYGMLILTPIVFCFVFMFLVDKVTIYIPILITLIIQTISILLSIKLYVHKLYFEEKSINLYYLYKGKKITILLADLILITRLSGFKGLIFTEVIEIEYLEDFVSKNIKIQVDIWNYKSLKAEFIKLGLNVKM